MWLCIFSLTFPGDPKPFMHLGSSFLSLCECILHFFWCVRFFCFVLCRGKFVRQISTVDMELLFEVSLWRDFRLYGLLFCVFVFRV